MEGKNLVETDQVSEAEQGVDVHLKTAHGIKPHPEALLDMRSESQVDIQPGGQMDKQLKGQVDKHPEGQADAQTERQIDSIPKGESKRQPKVEIKPREYSQNASDEDSDSTPSETELDAESALAEINQQSSEDHTVKKTNIRRRILIPMKQEYKEIIDEDYQYLSVCMRGEIERLIKHLVGRNVITDEQKEDIMDEISPTRKSQALLDYLIELDNSAYDEFYEGTLSSHLWKAADILKPENGPHEPDEEEIEDFLPDNWPTNSHIASIQQPTQMEIKKVVTKHARMMGYYERHLESSVYDMKSKKKGRVMIIANENFDREIDFPRKVWTQYDKHGLDQLFSRLGFEIDIVENQTTFQMWQTMQNVKDLSHYCSFVLIILSYGYDNKWLFGTNAGVDKSKGSVRDTSYRPDSYQAIDINEIKALFSTDQNLVNKPKVFIFGAPTPSSDVTNRKDFKVQVFKKYQKEETDTVASRNCEKDELYNDRSIGLKSMIHDGFSKPEIKFPYDDSFADIREGLSATAAARKSIPEELAAPAAPSSRFEASDLLSKMKINSHIDELMSDMHKRYDLNMPDFRPFSSLVEGDGPGGSQTAASMSDIYEAFFSCGDCLESDEMICGSWFIQAFIYVLANYAFQADMANLLAKVNNFAQNSDNQRRRRQKGESRDTICMPNSTLRSKLFFFPGLPH